MASAGCAGDALARHAGAELALDRRAMRARRALEAHRAAQLLGLAAGEAGGGHRHAQELLLEERHAERALAGSARASGCGTSPARGRARRRR